MEPARPIPHRVTGHGERVHRVAQQPQDGIAAATHGFHHHAVVDVDVADKSIVVTHDDGVRVMPDDAPSKHRSDGREPDDSCHQPEFPSDAGARGGQPTTPRLSQGEPRCLDAGPLPLRFQVEGDAPHTSSRSDLGSHLDDPDHGRAPTLVSRRVRSCSSIARA